MEQAITLEVIPTFECRDCNLRFDCKEDFSSHVEGIHNDPFPVKPKNTSKTCVECPECLVKFTQKNNLMRHIRRFHDSPSTTPRVKPTLSDSQECPECCIKFTRRSNLIRHFRRFHKSLVPSALPQKPKIYACPECDTKFTKLSNCRRHIRNFHLLKREAEQIQYSLETSNSLEIETSFLKCSVDIDFNADCPLENDSSFDKNNPDEDFNPHFRLNDDLSSDKIKLAENFQFDYQSISTDDQLEIEHKCFVCHAKLNQKDDLINHIRNYHNPNENNSPNGKLACSDCNKFYSTSFNLKRHVKHAHPEKVTSVVSDQNNSTVSELKNCPLCKYSDNKLNLYVHFTSVHNIPMVIECHEFDTLQKFEEWRARLEEETQSTFVRISKTLSTEISRMVLACSHSGTLSNNKSDFGFCPAEITVIVDNEKCTVYFVKGHVGHGTDENDSTDVEITELGLDSITVVDESS